MDYNNNLTQSLNLVSKYEIYRVMRFYSYLFILMATLYFLSNFFINYVIAGIFLLFYYSLFILPLTYTFILYFSINSDRPNYEFIIDYKLVGKLLLIISSFMIIPQIFFFLLLRFYGFVTSSMLFYSLQIFNPSELLTLYFLGSFFNHIYIHIELIPIGGILVSNFFVLRNYKVKFPKSIFLASGLFLLTYWILESIYLQIIYQNLFHEYNIKGIITFVYDSFPLLLLLFGIMFYIFSSFYLRRDQFD